MFKLKFLLTAAACLSATTQAAAPQIHPVLVRFQNLYWVGAKTVLPFVASGQTFVPPAETCDLLGLSCTLGKDTLSVGGQTFSLAPMVVVETAGRRTLSVTALAPLIKLAGQTLTWNATSKTAAVSGGSGSRGWRYALDYLGPLPDFYAGPLQTSRAAPQVGKPTVPQSILAAAPLNELTYFSKTANSLNIVGGQQPGLPDNPNNWPGCGGQTTCTLPVPRDALWVLAYATAK